MREIKTGNAAGEAISRRSFQIIRERLGSYPGTAAEEDIVVRVAHATGDVDFARTILFSPGAVDAGVAALRTGRAIVTDVEMVRAGIRARLAGGAGNACICLLDEPATAELARREGITRSAAAMRRAGGVLNGAVVAIGNAPTALFELMRLMRGGAVQPALVVGTPVGFVGALESKRELAAMETAHVTNLGERGGSPIAAAVVNGLLALAANAGAGG